MPTTASTPRPATERQLSFLRSLVAERAHLGDPRVQTVLARLAVTDVPMQLRETSALIAELVAIRVPRTTSAPVARRDVGAVDMPAPATDCRAGRMLAAGSIEATATLLDGRHVTVAIRTRTRSGRGWTNAALGDDGSQTTISILGSKVGWINRHGDQYRLTLRTRRPTFVAAINAVLAYAAGVDLLDGIERVQEATRCGRCFRSLTDPVSIDRGIGPECFGRDTGSQHVAAERAAIDAPHPASSLNDQTPAERDAESRATAARESREALRREREHDAAFAAREREQETAAFLSDPDYRRGVDRAPTRSLTDIAARAEVGVPRTDRERARDLIAEALDAYCGDADRDFAMRTFDELAR